MPDFSVRSLLPEIMDNPNETADATIRALGEIETINKWLGGYNVVLNALNNLQWPNREVTILDLGSGGGDTLRAIAEWADEKNKQVKLIGVDKNEVMTAYATGRSRYFNNIDFITMNVFDKKIIDIKPDIAMNSLFCHHFDNDELIQLITIMHKSAKKAVIINDIHRHWFAYYSIKMLTSVLGKADMVKYDAPLSVARSLTRSEWENILQRTGIKNYSLKWMWAWRWQIVINKSEVDG